jgi:hypothetical protein
MEMFWSAGQRLSTYQAQKGILEDESWEFVFVSRHKVDRNSASNRLTVRNQWSLGKDLVVWNIFQGGLGDQCVSTLKRSLWDFTA